MPRVHYRHVQIGVRRLGYTNPFAAAHGLGDVPIDPSGDTSFMYPDVSVNNEPLPTPASCAWWNPFSSSTCSLAAGQQQVQSVVSNAKAANDVAVAAGMPPPYDVAKIQAAANAGSAALAKEVPQLFSTPISLTDPSTWPWWMWAAGGYVAARALKLI
jgi:hypothetical protein